jgi:REP element-mobilizing transposase RayT
MKALPLFLNAFFSTNEPIATIEFNMKRAQASLIPRMWLASHFAFGGALLKGSHPKQKRPFRATLPLHIVLRSSRAVRAHSLLRFNASVEAILNEQSLRHHVRIFGAANAGNHLHLLIQAPSRELLAGFLRAISGRIAQLIEGNARERRREAFDKNFWDARPFSRLVSWGRDFKNVARYIGINSTETALREMSSEKNRIRPSKFSDKALLRARERTNVRALFEEIQQAVRSGFLKASPRLVAAGFV